MQVLIVWGIPVLILKLYVGPASQGGKHEKIVNKCWGFTLRHPVLRRVEVGQVSFRGLGRPGDAGMRSATHKAPSSTPGRRPRRDIVWLTGVTKDRAGYIWSGPGRSSG